MGQNDPYGFTRRLWWVLALRLAVLKQLVVLNNMGVLYRLVLKTVCPTRRKYLSI